MQRNNMTNQLCEACGRGVPMREVDLDQTITHCEWCGAEYPSPEPSNDTNPTTPTPDDDASHAPPAT